MMYTISQITEYLDFPPLALACYSFRSAFVFSGSTNAHSTDDLCQTSDDDPCAPGDTFSGSAIAPQWKLFAVRWGSRTVTRKLTHSIAAAGSCAFSLSRGCHYDSQIVQVYRPIWRGDLVIQFWGTV